MLTPCTAMDNWWSSPCEWAWDVQITALLHTSSFQVTNWQDLALLCLAATSSEAERIPLDYPKHLTRKWGVRRTFLKNISWMVQWANSTSNRDIKTSSRLWGKRSISCACPWSPKSKFWSWAQSLIWLSSSGLDVKQTG
jgi:hypothetical protein